MKFINPQFLWAFGVLIIPIIIHLFNFRRFKKVLFPNLRFLQEVQLKNKNKQEIKKWLVLASRLLALSFLVLAFAGPFLPGKDSGKAAAGNILNIYIDNSFSMNAEGTEGELLEVAKNRARNIVAAYGETDRFQLLTNDFEGRHQRSVSKENFLQWVDEVNYSPRSRNLSAVYERQKNQLNKEAEALNRRIAFQISDFQKTTADIADFQTDTTLALYFVPLQANSRNNVSIDSAWIENPYIRNGESANLFVRVKNFGREAVSNVTVTLALNGQQKGLVAIDLEAEAEQVAVIPFISEKEGWNNAVLQVQDFPIVFDDKLFLSFEVRNSRKVLLIVPDDKVGKQVKAVFTTDQFFQVDQQFVNQLDYRSFNQFDLIVIEELSAMASGLISELKLYVEGGGNLIIIPSKQGIQAGNALNISMGLPEFLESTVLQGEMNNINTDHPIYREIIEKVNDRMLYPAMYRYYPWKANAGLFENLIGNKEGVSILSLFNRGKGRVYLFSLPLSLEWSTLTRHFLFPTTLLQAGFRSISGNALYYRIGTDVLVPIKQERESKDEAYELLGKGEVLIPEIVVRDNTRYIRLGESVETAGNIELRRKSGTDPVQFLSLNFDRAESETGMLDNEAIKEILPVGLKANILDAKGEGIGKIIRELDSGKQLWKLAVLFALLFIVIEILLLRFLKTA